jgi:class 3 adenylate cyclase
MSHEPQSINELKKQLQALLKFPDQNPNPVLKTTMGGKLLYTNSAGQYIKDEWKIDIGDDVPSSVVDQSKLVSSLPLEMEVGNKTYAFHVVAVPEFDFINIYGTDITAMKAITKFPDQNPNPVLKTTMGGKLLYTNSAGQYIKDEWKIDIGDDVPSSVVDQSKLVSSLPLEMKVGNKTYAFHVVAVPEFDFINIYGTDVTAAEDNRLILLKLSKYFSPQVYESIFSGDLEVKIETRRKRLTVFFSDIKGFSELTERLEPEILTELVTSYLTEMTNIAIDHGGTVDKYIGDAIMVFFGDPKSLGHKEDAIACVQMAIAMVKALRSVRLSWENMGISQPLDIRIGVHTDTCTVGNFGSHDRLDYTTIGNGVNLASRLETNAEPNQILISEDTYLLVREKIKCRKLNKIRVKNIAHPIQTYEVVAHLNLDLLEEEIKEESDGFSVYIDPKTIDQIEKKKEILERALNLLSQID